MIHDFRILFLFVLFLLVFVSFFVSSNEKLYFEIQKSHTFKCDVSSLKKIISPRPSELSRNCAASFTEFEKIALKVVWNN